MSGYAPYKPDSRVFASYPMPAKIDLINEKPRRESMVEQQLANKIGEPSLPRIEVTEQQQFSIAPQNYQQQPPFSQNLQQNYQEQQQYTQVYTSNTTNNTQQQQQQQLMDNQYHQRQPQQMVQQQQQQNIGSQSAYGMDAQTTSATTTTTLMTNMKANQNAQLKAELAEKEAKLMADINELQQRPYSPFQVPNKIDLTNEQHKSQLQAEQAPSPRPYSRASSTRSASADFLDKEARLLQEIEEMEKKPFNPQTMVVEREEWFEYPQGRPKDRQLTDSKRRVKDFCSLPSYMYSQEGAHVHEENLSVGRSSPSTSGVHTTIIRSPKREIDNKSPLPFAFDNFTTKGVRGNIASVGAIEPDRPRPPIYPIIKRTPSPMAR